MRIYICKNCGDLTESEETEKLFCSNCGASLLPSKPQEKEEQPRPLISSSEQPRPLEIASGETSTKQPLSKPQQEVKIESTELKIPSTSEYSTQRSSTQKTEVPLDSLDTEGKTPTSVSILSSTGASPQQEQVPLNSTSPIMELYEDKDLVVCPQCGYGCNAVWAKCPICGAQIADVSNLQKITDAKFKFNEEDLKEKLIPCPKCQYSCDPNWESCPICQTKLKETE